MCQKNRVVQNLPQVVLQCVYLWKIGEFDEIAISSMVFSSISIIVTIVAMITEKQILNASGHAIIKFKVSGTMIVSKSSEYRNKTWGLKKSLSDVLGLNHKIIEILRPNKIPNGLQMTVNIHLNHIQSRDIDYKKLLIKCQQSGQLAEIIKTQWKLKAVPDVSSIDFQIQESKNRINSRVTISVQSVESIQSDIKTKDHGGKRGRGEVNNYHAGNIELEPMPQVNDMNMINTAGYPDNESSDNNGSDNDKDKGTTFGANTIGNDHNTVIRNDGEGELDNHNNDDVGRDDDVIQYVNKTAGGNDFVIKSDEATLM